jgi:hypothetical protein
LHEVFECRACPNAFGFTEREDNGPYLKFPPTIGSLGRVPLLFVGINPRRSKNNVDLFDRIMGDEREFARLADNRDGQRPYIAPGCKERHYERHMEIVQAMFGRQARFEDFAAVTELYFCGTRNARGLDIKGSPCADRFFERVFLKVKPRIVFCVWPPVLSYFQRIAEAGDKQSFLMTLGRHTALVLQMPR